LAVPQHRGSGALRKVGSFLWHLFKMVLAMEAGMALYHLVVAIFLGGTGYPPLTRQFPLFGYWMMVAGMVLGMVAYMRWQRSSWRQCIEMTVAMLAPVAALTATVAAGLLSITILRMLGDPAMILAMALFMLVRPGGHEHGTHGASRLHPYHEQGM